MKISNLHSLTTLRIVMGSAILVGLADLVLAIIPGAHNKYVFGYSIFIYPALVVAAYAYVGLPMFSIKGEKDLLKIKSHLIFNRFVGKEMFIPIHNILSMRIDRSGIRKKLSITYLSKGEEVTSKFGISFLSRKSLQKLADSIDMLTLEKQEINKAELFI